MTRLALRLPQLLLRSSNPAAQARAPLRTAARGCSPLRAGVSLRGRGRGHIQQLSIPGRRSPSTLLRAPMVALARSASGGSPSTASGLAAVGASQGDAPTTGEPFEASDVASLERWLASHGVPTEEYGVGTAKFIGDLFEECSKGETTLELTGGRPVRRVQVLQLLIRDDAGRVLVEQRQTFPDSRVRERHVALSEKLVGGEDWREAAGRAVAEELGSCLEEGYVMEVDEASYERREVDRESFSYPGLLSRYTMHVVGATLTGLPPGESFESTEVTTRGVMTVQWGWVEGFTGLEDRTG